MVLATATILYTYAQAAVAQPYFNETSVSNGVFLRGETASELDTLGFFVHPSTSAIGGYTRASSFIPTSGGLLLDGYYQYVPTVSAVASTNNTTTQTDAATNPASNSQTGATTPTAIARARTPTAASAVRARSRASTSSQYTYIRFAHSLSGFLQPAQQPPPPPTESQEQSTGNVMEESQTNPITGTATLIPLPEITMEFPSLSVSNPPIPTPPSLPPVSVSSILRWITPTRVLIAILIVFVWLFLGGWFYSTIRRLE